MNKNEIEKSGTKEDLDDTRLLTLKEAREIANQITIEERVEVPVSGLADWISMGVITGPEGYNNQGKSGGRVGLYRGDLPIQIAVVAELKLKYSLAEIAKIAQKLLPEIEREGNINKSLTKRMLDIREEMRKMDPEKRSVEGFIQMMGKNHFELKYLTVWKKYEMKKEGTNL